MLGRPRRGPRCSRGTTPKAAPDRAPCNESGDYHQAREETRRARAKVGVEAPNTSARRRSVLDATGKPISQSEGAVRGWLDASRSDYNDSEGKPAALWHVYFSSGELEGDEEDLELSELLESLVPKSDDTDDEAPMKLPPVPRAKKATDDEKKKDRGAAARQRRRSTRFGEE